ncbi:MAG: hypothetical protein IT332_02880 [Ardenticatenales bacterium]|nr:hypothetical protein [Ardenticatenales bacterium]
MPKRTSTLKRPRDPNALAALIVAEATDETPAPVTEPATPEPSPDAPVLDDGKNPAAVALGKLGGKKGGPARMAKLTPEERSALAKKAAAKRWERSQGEAQ